MSQRTDVDKRALARDAVKIRFRRLFLAFLKTHGQRLQDQDLARPAIVFSPHPDDETLGCGGTIIKKKKLGGDVKVVFMTDGTQSHRRYIPEQELMRLRTREAISACSVLGLEETSVFFLNFKDGHLMDQQEAAIDKVKEILSRVSYEEVYIPYFRDFPSDHRTTNFIVLSAIKMLRKRTAIYEYPIWFWHHWPWVSVPAGCRRDALEQAKACLFSWISLLKDFRWSVAIEEVLEHKRLALNQHRSQMVRLISNSPWPILSDVSGGEFLECFFREREFFYKHVR